MQASLARSGRRAGVPGERSQVHIRRGGRCRRTFAGERSLRVESARVPQHNGLPLPRASAPSRDYTLLVRETRTYPALKSRLSLSTNFSRFSESRVRFSPKSSVRVVVCARLVTGNCGSSV